MSRSSRKKKSTRKQSGTAYMIILVGVVVVCLVSFVRIGSLHNQSKELANTERSLEQQIEQATVKHNELVAEEQYMKTNQYIEDEAKSKFGLVYPDEIVIKPAE
jgi:cell division protein FtsB